MRYSKTCNQYFQILKLNYCTQQSSGPSLDPSSLQKFLFQKKIKGNTPLDVNLSRQFLNRLFDNRLENLFQNYAVSDSLNLDSVDNYLNLLLKKIVSDFPDCNFLISLFFQMKVVLELSGMLLKCLLAIR